MMALPLLSVVVALLASAPSASALQFPSDGAAPAPRRAFVQSIVGASATAFLPFELPAFADDDTPAAAPIAYETRDRNKNKDALIREDYWYFSGKRPPRLLNPDALPADDPTWNAWGECTKSETTGNSCVYVSLKQRQPTYGKYAFSISLGASEYQTLGAVLRAPTPNWNEAAELVDPGYESRMPSPAVDSLLKMALFATGMLTSPNFSGPNREFLVCRYYVNECAFALRELASAIDERDAEKARGLWEYGRDSYNSYFGIVNRSISPKVGEKFEMIS